MQRQCVGMPRPLSCAEPREHVSQGRHLIGAIRYLAPGGDRTCRLSAGIKSVFAFVMLGTIRSCKKARLDIGPGAIVEGFLLGGSAKSARGTERCCTRSYLAPKDICVGICIEVRSNLENNEKPFHGRWRESIPNHKGMVRSVPRG
jgi:hypothetical protein